jgi:outer membrane lipoprotein-sorting protein
MVSMAGVVCFACGCAVSQKTVVPPAQAPAALQTATEAQLIERYNNLAQGIQSINAGVTMKLTAGSAYSGVIEQYHEVNGFIVAARPVDIRVIGQAPVVSKDIFDMVSDGSTFSIYIPSKHKFIVGPANLEPRAEKPIENLRPQHLLDALFMPEIPKDALVLVEEASEAAARYYVLTVVRSALPASGVTEEIARKVWFDRTDLHVSRIENFGSGGKVVSDVGYADWQPIGDKSYARKISVTRPGDDYQLQIEIKKLTVNEPTKPEQFILAQPPGTDLVHAEQEGGEKPGQTTKEPQP